MRCSTCSAGCSVSKSPAMRTGPATALFAIYADERQVSFVRCRTWCLEPPSHLYNDEYQIIYCCTSWPLLSLAPERMPPLADRAQVTGHQRSHGDGEDDAGCGHHTARCAHRPDDARLDPGADFLFESGHDRRSDHAVVSPESLCCRGIPRPPTVCGASKRPRGIVHDPSAAARRRTAIQSGGISAVGIDHSSGDVRGGWASEEGDDARGLGRLADPPDGQV
jgi:hypothetical protein